MPCLKRFELPLNDHFTNGNGILINYPLAQKLAMNLSLLKLHFKTIILLFVVFFSLMFYTFSLGELKQTSLIDWFDVLGEGSINLMIVIWIFFTMISRPKGKVTHLLISGLAIMQLSMMLDFLDEFIHYPQTSAWISTIESLPAPIGMIMMTIALYYWHQEQTTLNTQLIKKERFYREHSLTDFITGLYSIEYMKNQISREVNLNKCASNFSVIMLDVCNFDAFNRQFGDLQGNKLLREFANLILMNIRDTDLACRFAADRFIILLPDTNQKTADEIAQQIQQSVSHLAYKPGQSSQAVYHQFLACIYQHQQGDNYTDLISKLNQNMLQTKLTKIKKLAA